MPPFFLLKLTVPLTHPAPNSSSTPSWELWTFLSPLPPQGRKDPHRIPTWEEEPPTQFPGKLLPWAVPAPHPTEGSCSPFHNFLQSFSLGCNSPGPCWVSRSSPIPLPRGFPTRSHRPRGLQGVPNPIPSPTGSAGVLTHIPTGREPTHPTLPHPPAAASTAPASSATTFILLPGKMLWKWGFFSPWKNCHLPP